MGNMAPKKKADEELGSVVPRSGPPPYQVRVKLDGKNIHGPKRQERCDAEADLKAMRARPRSEMAETLKGLAPASKRPSHSDESHSSVVPPTKRCSGLHDTNADAERHLRPVSVLAAHAKFA